jgi:uncharacterized protein (TIGR00369 family)
MQHERDAAVMAELGWVRGQADDNFAGLVGPLWSRQADDERQFAFVVEDKHLNVNDRAHGAALMWLLDKSLSQASVAACGNIARIVTVQLDVHFIEGARLGQMVLSQCKVTRVTRSMVFTTGQLTSDGKVLATASGVWKYRRAA